MELMKDICDVIDIPLPLVLLLSIDEDSAGKSRKDDKVVLKPIVENILLKLFSEGQFDISKIDKTIQQLKKRSEGLQKVKA